MPARSAPALGTALALAFLAAASTSRAQDQAAPAESLFEEGRALLAAQKYPEACAKLAESERLDPAVGTLLNLAECYEKMGKVATAWTVFKDAASMAHTGKQTAREKLATARALALEPKLPRLSIRVQHPSSGLDVKRDGLTIGQAEWSGPLPSAVTIDPGDHDILVTAPGKKPWSTKVTLTANGATTPIEVPELEADELAERAPMKPASAPLASLDAVNAHDRNVQRALGIAMGGLGLVSVIVSVPFGVRAISLNKTAAGECPTNSTCTSQGASDASSAVTTGLVSTVLLSVGAGVAVGGAIVFLTAPAPRAAGTAIRVSPQIGPGTGGLSLAGSF